MKQVCSHWLFLLMIILPLISGCVTGEQRFAERDRFLLLSREVGPRERPLQKLLLASFDFDSADSILNCPVAKGEWQVKDGRLWAVGGEHDRCILLAQGAKGPLRIELEVTNYANPDGSLGDITLFINSSKSNYFSRGYALTTGSYYNNCTTIYRQGHALAKTEYSPLVSGKKYKVTVELTDGHMRYWLDDKIILEAWDPNPLEPDPGLWIGLRTYNTKMAADSFSVYWLNP